ncbi:uncharacterized protein LOC120005208 isoform X3 [Tripterygium wilfordii]|uniref:uncharacterized protein LOC120005208 isoform X3 n=1 Tax=Tripterygium wilfordii TaxID=458696 RepID=UPI0018F7F621|nr:uncharacterized protein LOC120005208 isoform X3 [Tripterygium wilfordii]
MMQRPSLLWSSILLYPSHTALCTFRRLTLPLGPQLVCDAAASSSLQFSLTRLRNYRHAIPPLHSTGTRETVETTKTGTEFVEVGYLSSAHGLHGEICVKPSTDFPELRFSKPGRRWLKQLVSGKETIQEVQLVEGRGHPGQKSWILKFEGVDVVDQAKQLVGSMLLVRKEDRPQLEEGEFYTRDLVGMRVMLKETGEPLGTVVNVFNYGASDILRVMLDSSVDKPEKNLKSTPRETDISGRLVWVPFVEAIVPDVDMIRRELQITPPKGLLELNFRSDDRSKKERRQIEWKERKRSQRRLIAAKKKLSEMEQQHVFHGFRFGEKMQRSLLADQIVGVNSKLLQQALKSVTMSTERLTDTEIFSATKTKLVSNTIKISKDFLTTYSSEKESAVNFNYKEKGISLMSKGKVASILFVQDIERWRCSELDHVDSDCVDSSSFSVLQSLLSDNQRFVKVWVLEEEKLPVISSSPEEQNKHKILMKSPWEILQSPVGSGGVISLLATQNILENLTEIGVQYVEICSTSQEYASGSPMLLGLANSCEADVGIQIVEDAKDLEENLRTVFSMNFMKKLTNHVEKLQFYAVPKSSSYVEMVDKEWIDVTPSSTNSFELRCSIYSALNACSLDKMCVMEVTE